MSARQNSPLPLPRRTSGGPWPAARTLGSPSLPRGWHSTRSPPGVTGRCHPPDRLPSRPGPQEELRDAADTYTVSPGGFSVFTTMMITARGTRGGPGISRRSTRREEARGREEAGKGRRDAGRGDKDAFGGDEQQTEERGCRGRAAGKGVRSWESGRPVLCGPGNSTVPL